MADKTKIEWSDATWNPVTGCEKVSPGCDNCYALTFAERFRGTEGHYFEGGFDVQLRPDKLDQPLRWTKPRKVFVNSMSDVFHDDVPDDFIAKVFAMMAATPHHTFQLLTKRHGRMRSLLNNLEWRSSVFLRESVIDLHGPERAIPSWPLPNVWLGVSVEDQKRADLRIPALLDTPASVRWISAEPLLGPVDFHGPIVHPGHRPKLNYWLHGRPDWGPEETTETGLITQRMTVGPRLDWVVVGGESGPGARPMDLAWARLIVEQCQDAKVPVFVKQLGSEWAKDMHYGGKSLFSQGDRKGGDWSHWPADLRVREFPEVPSLVKAG